MQPVRVALAQIDPKLGDVSTNLARHLETVETARREGAGLVVFPELSLTGYLLRDQVPDVAVEITAPVIRRLAEDCRDLDVVVGFVEETPGHRFHNAAAYLSGGDVVHVHRKLYLPTYGLFDEGRDFSAGEVLRSFETRFGRAGILLCEDLWHAMSAWLLAQSGTDLLIVPSSGPSRGTQAGEGVTSVLVWHELLRVTARFQTCFVAYANRVGYEDGLNFGGGSVAYDPFGREVVCLEPVSPGIGFADLDPEVLRRARTAYPLLRDADVELVYRELGRLRRERFELPDDDPEGAGR